MPYTPPAQQSSPASSKSQSPNSSRNSSITDNGPRSPSVGRPTPPRSASYIQRQRRSPSITRNVGQPPTPTETVADTSQAKDFAAHDSIRQSPPPRNDQQMPPGAITTPPDSSESSDSEESSSKDHRRSWDQTMDDQLRLAVEKIDLRREGSPERASARKPTETTSEPVSQSTSPTALSAEQRKISHSRSSTETAIIIPRTAHFDSPTQTSSDDEDEDGPLSKPTLVRKKSGELVKPALRPSSRRRYSSMPGTPTYSKSVHFNDNGNQTKHFLQVDKPIAVSAGTSPVETYEDESEFPFPSETKATREIRLSNFPDSSIERRSKPIWVEQIFLSEDKNTLIGVCTVQNISFHKQVVARFTLDYWKTTSEIAAEYNNDPRHPPAPGCDRFNFHIKLSDQANVETKTLQLCVRYNVGGQEFWDNNSNMNYQIDFTKVTDKPPRPTTANIGIGPRPHTAIPRSRHTTPVTRGRQESIDDDFVARFDDSSSYQFGSPDKLLGDSPNAIKLKPRTKRINPSAPTAQPANGLGGRYDFGASLSAALSSAQDKLGQKSGLMGNSNAQKPSRGSYFGPLERKQGPTKTAERPDAITTDRPSMNSDQYKDLVQKFCYFTPGSGKPITSPQPKDRTPPPPRSAPNPDGAADDTDSTTSTISSGPNTPSPLPYDGSNDHHHGATPVFSPIISRSGSPTPVMGSRSASPMSCGLGFHAAAAGEAYFSAGGHTPTAIHG